MKLGQLGLVLAAALYLALASWYLSTHLTDEEVRDYMRKVEPTEVLR